MSDLVLARNCCLARMLPGEAELVSEWTGLPGKAKSVKRFERSNGLDTALYKNYIYLFISNTISTFRQASQGDQQSGQQVHRPGNSRAGPRGPLHRRGPHARHRVLHVSTPRPRIVSSAHRHIRHEPRQMYYQVSVGGYRGCTKFLSVFVIK